jgi:hypothetical protein
VGGFYIPGFRNGGAELPERRNKKNHQNQASWNFHIHDFFE